MNHPRIIGSLSLLVVLLVSACAKGPPPEFYLLDPGAEGQLPGFERGTAVGVGPIDIPEHLDRNQIVSRISNTQLMLEEAKQWSEPLKDGVARVLAINLALALDSNRIFVLPQRQKQKLDYRFGVDIARLDGAPGGEVVLAARWVILSGDGDQLLHSQVSRIVKATADTSYDAYVSAQSRALATLAVEAAQVITGF